MTKFCYRLTDHEADTLISRWEEAKSHRTFFKWVNEQLPFPMVMKGTIFANRPRLYVYANEETSLIHWKLAVL